MNARWQITTAAATTTNPIKTLKISHVKPISFNIAGNFIYSLLVLIPNLASNPKDHNFSQLYQFPQPTNIKINLNIWFEIIFTSIPLSSRVPLHSYDSQICICFKFQINTNGILILKVVGICVRFTFTFHQRMSCSFESFRSFS